MQITPALISVAPELCVTIIILLVLRRMKTVFAEPENSAATDSQTGAVTVEFMMVFPLLLAILLVELQIGLLIPAKFVVNYAAGRGVRAAIVTIPERVKSAKTGRIEEHNQINLNDPDSPKLNLIRRAAALPCTTISPKWSPKLFLATGTMFNPALVTQLSPAGLLFPLGSIFEMTQELVSRAHYAFDPQNLKIEVLHENATNKGAFKAHEWITVRVTFRQYLAIPFANRLFGKSYFGGWWSHSGYYLPIAEQYSLPNDGEPLYPSSQAMRFEEVVVEP